jgi:hypothetical protein
MRRAHQLACSAIAAITLNSNAVATRCPIEQARYVYTAKKIVGTAEFLMPPRPAEKMAGSVAMHVIFKDAPKSGKAIFDAWFFLNQGNAPEISLVESTDPRALAWKSPLDLPAEPNTLPYLTFYAWNEDHKVIYEAPYRSSSAPKYFFIPMLATGIALSTKKTIGFGMFKFDHCAE